MTKDGEITEKKVCELNLNKIRDEEKHDGFYAVITNLKGDIGGRTDLTNDLHEAFGFHTDYEFISKSAMRSIIKSAKTEKVKKQHKSFPKRKWLQPA